MVEKHSNTEIVSQIWAFIYWIMSLPGIHSCYILFKLVEEMATSAGLQCELDPVLCQALRVHKGACELDNANGSIWVAVL